MIQGFSNATPAIHPFTHLSFDAAMPMPFKIPIVFMTLLDPKTDLNFTRKQQDLLEALRLSYTGKTRLFQEMAVEEQKLIEEMTLENADTEFLTEEYSKLQTHKMEASEVFFDILNALAEELEASQYHTLMELCHIKV